MPLTETEIDAIRASFRQLTRDSERAGALFYQTLFEIAPETRPLFVGDLREQATKLMSTLGLVVSQLHTAHTLMPVVEDLAVRHLAYGVRPNHYAMVGQALDSMLGAMLTGDAVPEQRAAWARAYASLSGAMIAAAYDQVA